MGNCNCIDERADKDVRVESFGAVTTLKPKSQAGNPGVSDPSATSFELIQPHPDLDPKPDQGRQSGVSDPPVDDHQNQHYEDISTKPTSGRRQQAGAPTNQEQPVAVDAFDQNPPALGLAPKLVPQDAVRALQGACRILLAKLKARAAENRFHSIPDPVDVEEERGTQAPKDPFGMLTPEARRTYSSLPPFVYSYSVKGVIQRPPQLLADRSVYSGQWATAKSGGMFRKGKGKAFLADGSFCEGYWLGPQLHTRARIIYANGDYYEGAVKEGERHGMGVLRSYDGQTEYEGSWAENTKHGQGKERLPDGSVYNGEFNRSKRSGMAKYTFGNGKVYEGNFLDGLFDGLGKHFWPDGRFYDGMWKANKMHGHGKFISADKKVYDGEYRNDKKHGYGRFEFDGNVYEGPWEDGKMHGVGYLTTPDKGKRKFEFKDNVRGKEIKSND